MFKNILVIGHSNIGDVCYDLAVVDPLKTSFPDSKITFLTSTRAKNIVEGYKGIDTILTFDKLAKDKGLAGRFRLMSALKKERFDLAVVLKSTWMHRFLGIPQTWNARKFIKKTNKHVVDAYLDFLSSHGLMIDRARFNFTLGDEEKMFCGIFLAERAVGGEDKLVGILPNAAWSLKNWPIEKWNELAETLLDKYGVITISLGKLSSEPFDQVVAKKLSPRIISAEKTTLKQAMAMIRRCDLFIGPDSSLLHLASCLGTETIGLYGPTPVDVFYPYFHRKNCLTPKNKPDCLPCYPSLKFCPCKEELTFGECMEDISVEDVLKLIKQKLAL